MLEGCREFQHAIWLELSLLGASVYGLDGWIYPSAGGQAT